MKSIFFLHAGEDDGLCLQGLLYFASLFHHSVQPPRAGGVGVRVCVCV